LRILKTAFQENDYDGFELSFTPSSSADDDKTIISPFEFAWRRDSKSRSKGWELRLDLFSESGEVRGSFSITRSYTKGSLLGDIDCFAEEFIDALSLALQRASESQAMPIGMLATALNISSDVASVA
jgi:hypothetical protein